MGVTTYTQEFNSSIAPSRLFKALVIDSHNLIPKVAPEGISSIEFIEGDGGVGSIKKTTFSDGNPLKWVKHRIDVIDSEHLVSKYTLIETGVDFDKIDFVNYEVKFEAHDGGSLIKNISEYHTKEGVELKDEDIKGGKDKAFGLYKVVEEYLNANPDVYA